MKYTVEYHTIPNPAARPSQALIWLQETQGLAEMGCLGSKESSAPPSGTPAYFMPKNYGPGSCKCLQKWQHLTKDNLKLQWPLWGIFQIDEFAHLRSTFESEGSQIKQTK